MAYGTIKVDTITFTDAGVDKSVTISGLVQNPTFSGNITVTGTVSGNTIQGQTVSGATITGGAAAFTTVTGGVATITSGVFALGSASNPSISFTGDANSGLYSPGADQVAISTAGSGRLFVDASGNINIGSSFAGFGNGSGVEIQRSTTATLRLTGNSGVGCEFYNTGSLASIQTRSAIPFTIQTNEQERLRITSAGLVGVGTSVPGALVDISGSGNIIRLGDGTNTFDVRFKGPNNWATQLDTSADTFSIQRNSTSFVTIDGAGRLGVGTTSPVAPLDVNGNISLSGNGTNPRYLALLSETSTYAGSYILQAGGGSAGFGGAITMYGHSHATYPGSVYIGTSSGSSGSIIFGTNNAIDPANEKVRITSAGLVGIGTSAPGQNITVQSSASGTAPTFKLQNPVDSNSSQGAANNLSAGQLLFGATGSYPLTAKIESVYNADASFGRSAKLIISGANGSGTLTERLTIDEGGRVGIGTTSPGTTLSIGASATGGYNGGVLLNRGAASYNFYEASDGTNSVIFGLDNTLPVAKIGSVNSYPIGFFTGNSERLRITAAGLVGIGTTLPAYALDVASSVAQVGNSTDAFIQYKSTAGNWHVGAGNSNAFVVYSGTYGSGTERARIDSSGRLLVGTSSYDGNARVVVQGNTSSNTTGALVVRYNGTRPLSAGEGIGSIRFESTSQTNANYHYASISCDTDGTSGSDTDIPGRLVFSTTPDGASSPLERLRITSGGAISCGPQVSGADLVGTEACGFVADGVYAPVYKIKSSLTSDKNAALFFNGNGQVGGILMSGSSTAYNTSSDYRLKENVAAVTDGITRLQQLKPSRFNFIADPTKTVDGFIAHEAQAVVPECVSGEKDAVDDDGNPVYQGIDQSKLVPLLTAALQEAIGEIESLKARVVALESKP
jgi:hypothetical protein